MVTLDDIAAETGFDKSTVSITLRKMPRAARFSAGTRERIEEAARRMGYRPNLFAQQLADKKPRMLMLCVNYIQDPFAMTVAEGFEAQAGEMGLRVLITAIRDRQDPLALHRDILGVQGVPAMALVGGSARKLPDESLVKLADGGLKMVLVNRQVEHRNIGQVRADEAAGGRLAAEHVYGQGVRDVWVIGGMEGPAFRDRLGAIRAVAAARGAPEPVVVESVAGPGLDWVGAADAAVGERLARCGAGRGPQAMVALADALALGAARAAERSGLRVGRDVAVTGYDDGVYARMFWPPLTTVRLPMADMGRAAAAALMRMLERAEAPAVDVVLPVELMVRESGRVDQGAK